jgi:hypothetical protein
LMHGRRLIREHLAQMEREGREVSLIEAINEVLTANYPTEIVSAIVKSLLAGATRAERELMLKESIAAWTKLFCDTDDDDDDLHRMRPMSSADS